MTHKTLYKFLRTGLKSNKGENRDWKIGEWRKEESIEICSTGFHASQNPAHALSYVQGEILALVEVKGESVSKKYKECWSEMRIKKAWHWKKEDSIAFAIFVAEQVIGIYEKQYPNDDRPRKSIEAAKKYLKNPTKENKNAAYAAYAAADSATYAVDVVVDFAYAALAAYAADAAADSSTYAAGATADSAYAAAVWEKLGEWMEKRIKTLEPYNE